jgi:hypothetical protein
MSYSDDSPQTKAALISGRKRRERAVFRRQLAEERRHQLVAGHHRSCRCDDCMDVLASFANTGQVPDADARLPSSQSDGYRIIVCGSRTFTDRKCIVAWLRQMTVRERRVGPITIVHGACPTGADAIVDEEAPKYGFAVEQRPADWSLGRKAGPLRNREMRDAGADECIAFWDGKSRGTLGMVNLARDHGIRTAVYREGDADIQAVLA